MALRELDLERPVASATIYRFPTERVRAAAARGRARERRRQALRRRRTAALAAVGVAVVTITLFAGGPESSAPASRAQAPRSIVVRPGQTLWDIAERYSPESLDPRAYVDAVIETNDVGGAVPAGTRLVLPR